MNADFVENVAAGVDALGLTYSPIVFALAQVQWESPQDRDTVLAFLAGEQGG